MGAREAQRIQMQASNRRSSRSAELSVQGSTQEIYLARALRELKRAVRRARVVRESSSLFFPHPPSRKHELSTADGQTNGGEEDTVGD